MSSADQARVDELFLLTLELPPENRAEFLDRQCANEVPELRDAVERLLDAHEQAGQFSEQRMPPAMPAIDQVPSQRDPWTDKELGDYVIRRRIGRGGYGTVYLGERIHDYQQKVAIKLLRPELMADEMAIHRFHSEREALAVLQHEYIVRLLDGGSTGDGSPYFVMEYIEGEPITNYSDHQRLSIDARLALFQKVCAAVTFAHDMGYIHRDIKPTNILVTGGGIPKLLDFGIAKLVDARTRRQLVSLTGAGMPGTPEYASPEQITGDARLINVTTDVYSLGVVLYQLLTGRLPYDFKRPVLAEIQRVICEEDPIRPSTLIGSTRGDPLSDVVPATSVEETSAHRQTTPAGLRNTLQGDLETIVLKALRKESELRYASVAALSRDIQNFREGRPVEAQPATLVYRCRKLVHRHQLMALTVGCELLLALTTAAFAWLAHESRLRQQAQEINLRERLEEEKRNNAMERALDAAVNLDLARAEEAVKTAERHDASSGWLRFYRGVVAFYRGDLPTAVDNLEQSVALEPDGLAARAMLAVAYLFSGQLQQYTVLLYELESLHPQSYVDYLCLGFAETEVDPALALKSISAGMQMRDSSMARLMRATARSLYGVQMGDIRMADLAIEDVVAANTFRPDSLIVDIVTVGAHVNAANIHRAQGNSEKFQEHLQAATNELHRLEKSDLTSVHMARADYYLSLREPDAIELALASLEQAVDQGAVGTSALKYAALLYQRGQLHEAADVLERLPPPRDGATELTRGILRAELHGEEGALALLKDFEQSELQHTFPIAGQYLLLFLGQKERARQRAGALLQTVHAQPLPKAWLTQAWHSLQFDAGEIFSQQYLARAKPNLALEARAAFHLALSSLADGNRTGAAEQYGQVLARMEPTAALYLWSQAMLQRIEADPAWPPWIGKRPARDPGER